jgi:hypothetical protein
VRGAVRDTADTRYWLARGAEYLEAVPAVENMRGQLESMAKAIRTAAGAPTPHAYGEMIRESEMGLVFVHVRRAAQGAIVLEIIFDYSL